MNQTDSLEKTTADCASEPPGAVVSAIIPTYRSGEVLAAALDSILGQTRPPEELIVVDDGSPASDTAADVCDGYSSAVQYIRQDNQGASAARNAGIAAARGNWLAFLDADDVWEPDKLACQLDMLACHPEAAFSVTASNAWSATTGDYVTYRWTGSLDPDVMRSELLVRNILTGLCSSLLVRREALESVGCFDAGKASEDRRLAIRLLEKHQAVLIDEPLIRQQPGPAHWTNPERHRTEMLSLLRDHDDLLRSFDRFGFLRMRAAAKVRDRTGMHYLENGDLSAAWPDLLTAALHWPLSRNPWRVLLNYACGRLLVSRPCA